MAETKAEEDNQVSYECDTITTKRSIIIFFQFSAVTALYHLYFANKISTINLSTLL